MRKAARMLVYASAVMLPVVALAQMPSGVPAPGPDPAFINGAIAALQQQRNAALDQVAQSQAQSAVLQSKLDAAQKELAAMREAAEKPKNATPVPEKK